MPKGAAGSQPEYVRNLNKYKCGVEDEHAEVWWPVSEGGSVKSWGIGIIGLVGLTAIVVGAYSSPEMLMTTAVVLALAVGIGWPHFLEIPAKKTLAALIGLPAAGSAVAATYTPAPAFLDWTPAFMAAGVLAVFVMQLIRGTGQAQRLESILGSCAGVLLACLGAGWIAASRFSGVREMLLVAAISAGVALVTGLIRWPDRIVAPLGIVLAGLAAPLAGLVFTNIAVVPAAVVGVVIGSVLLSFRRLVILRGEALTVPAAVGVALAPVLAVGSLAYFIDKILIY